MGWVSAHVRKNGSYVPGHYRRDPSDYGSGYRSHHSVSAVSPPTCAGESSDLFGDSWRATKRIGRSSYQALRWSWRWVMTIATRLCKPAIMCARISFGWVASARSDIAKEDATGDNPAGLTAKLVAPVVGLFVAFVLGSRIYKWAGRLLVESAQIP